MTYLRFRIVWSGTALLLACGDGDTLARQPPRTTITAPVEDDPSAIDADKMMSPGVEADPIPHDAGSDADAGALAAVHDDAGEVQEPVAPDAGALVVDADGGVPATLEAAVDAALPDAGPDGVVASDAQVDAAFSWRLPPGFPEPPVPTDNPMRAEKVALGRLLFYDKRLSFNGTSSCGSCHEQARAFTDGRTRGVGSTGELHPRSSMSLFNVAYSASLTWANPLMTSLERQAHIPILGDDPIELGMRSVAEVEGRFRSFPEYRALFAAAFPDDPAPVGMLNLTKALAAFQRSLISGGAPFDRYLNGEVAALDESARRGHVLFGSDRLKCARCHFGVDFSDQTSTAERPLASLPFHNTGLYDIDGQGAYPVPNTGLENVTGAAADMGMFKVPTLRNIARTAPYMHDGSIATLSLVIDHYAMGGRARSARTDSLLTGFTLSEQERADLLAFLDSLTDEAALTDPAYSDPFAATDGGSPFADPLSSRH